MAQVLASFCPAFLFLSFVTEIVFHFLFLAISFFFPFLEIIVLSSNSNFSLVIRSSISIFSAFYLLVPAALYAFFLPVLILTFHAEFFAELLVLGTANQSELQEQIGVVGLCDGAG